MEAQRGCTACPKHTHTLAQHPGNVTSEPAFVTSTCNYLHTDSTVRNETFHSTPHPDNEGNSERPWWLRGYKMIPGSGGFPGEGNGYPLQYSCLENPTERGAWRALQSIGSQRTGHDRMTNTCTLLPMLPLAPLRKLYFPLNPEMSVIITAFHRCKNNPRGGQ